ncbi:MAG: DUF4249 family protein [Bacteroidales bacterium]|nr:DUF4249 family protein [Bacteroidales bacterium]
MKHLLFLGIMATMLLLAGCQGDELNRADPVLVVEGWIEDGEFPCVFVTSSIPVSTAYQSLDDLGQYLIRYARVAVSDGDTTVILTGKVDRDIFPPYHYTTSYLRGKAGKTYTLTVDYGDHHVSGQTTIPAPVPVDSFVVEPSRADSFYSMKAWFYNERSEDRYYKVFTRHHSSEDRLYYSPFICSYEGAILPDTAAIEVFWEKRLGWGEYRIYFHINDTVDIRFCTMDYAAWQYWSDYEAIIALSRNQLLNVTDNLPTNLSGGIGYWCGYGSRYYTVSIREAIGE